MKNREERRKYERAIKHKLNASICPLCGRPALFFTQGRIKPEAEAKEKLEKEDIDVVLVCENCGQVVHDEPEVGKLLQPGVYLPIKLDIFEYALRHPEQVDEALATNEIIDADFTEVDDECCSSI